MIAHCRWCAIAAADVADGVQWEHNSSLLAWLDGAAWQLHWLCQHAGPYRVAARTGCIAGSHRLQPSLSSRGTGFTDAGSVIACWACKGQPSRTRRLVKKLVEPHVPDKGTILLEPRDAMKWDFLAFTAILGNKLCEAQLNHRAVYTQAPRFSSALTLCLLPGFQDANLEGAAAASSFCLSTLAHQLQCLVCADTAGCVNHVLTADGWLRRTNHIHNKCIVYSIML